MEFTSKVELAKEVENMSNRPSAFSGRTYPVEYLGDREFEILTFFLFQTEIVNGVYGTKYDGVELMKGVGERGRDIVLIKDNKNCGVVQCKKYSSLITRPDFCREVIKFLLHLIQDSSLIDGSYHKDFDYYLVSVKGLNETAQELVKDFSKNIQEATELESWTNEVIKNNKSIKFKSYNDVKVALSKFLEAINVKFLSGHELDKKLKGNKEVVSVFFEIEKVATESMVREVLGEFNFKGLNDADLKRLLGKLENIPKEKRLLLGFANFYGYPVEFLKKAWSDGKLKNVMFDITRLRADIDKLFIDFLLEKVRHLQLIFISGSREIHPFTKQAVHQYLFAKYSIKFQRRELGEFVADRLEEYNSEKDFSVHSSNTIGKVKRHILESGKRYLEKDFSNLVGDEELKREKIAFLDFIHQGLESVEAMSTRFDQDMEKIKGVLPDMEHEVEKVMPINPTIILEEPNALDKEEAIRRMLAETDKLK